VIKPTLLGLLEGDNSNLWTTLSFPLRPIVSSVGSPSYALAGFLYKLLSPLAGKSESSVKNSDNFIQLLRYIDLQHLDILVSFIVVSLFTNVPVDEPLEVISKKLHNFHTLSECSTLPVKAIMELFEV
jgi:hypothetical protein